MVIHKKYYEIAYEVEYMTLVLRLVILPKKNQNKNNVVCQTLDSLNRTCWEVSKSPSDNLKNIEYNTDFLERQDSRQKIRSQRRYSSYPLFQSQVFEKKNRSSDEIYFTLKQKIIEMAENNLDDELSELMIGNSSSVESQNGFLVVPAVVSFKCPTCFDKKVLKNELESKYWTYKEEEEEEDSEFLEVFLEDFDLPLLSVSMRPTIDKLLLRRMCSIVNDIARKKNQRIDDDACDDDGAQEEETLQKRRRRYNRIRRIAIKKIARNSKKVFLSQFHKDDDEQEPNTKRKQCIETRKFIFWRRHKVSTATRRIIECPASFQSYYFK